MDAIKALLSRRSIRQYTDRPISDDTIEQLLKVAMAAPSAGNQQPWHFIVITDKNVLASIPKVHPYSGMLKAAEAAIVIAADVELEKHKGFWVQDCSAATENLLLGTHALGLGGVWLGVYPDQPRVKGLSKLLSLPEGIIPLSIVSLGYPNEEKPSSDRYNPERVHKNAW